MFGRFLHSSTQILLTKHVFFGLSVLVFIGNETFNIQLQVIDRSKCLCQMVQLTTTDTTENEGTTAQKAPRWVYRLLLIGHIKTRIRADPECPDDAAV